MDRPDPVFLEPWHAQLFALTVHLNQTGKFTWPDWASRFSETLKRHGVDRDLDGGEDYFNAWLETLQEMLAADGTAPKAETERVKEEWRAAYLATPHGAPVAIR